MSITIFTGPMFSGKTNRLILELNKISHSNNKIIFIKYIEDNRYTTEDNKLISNDKYEIINNSIVVKELKTSLSILLEYDYIFIDEGQFFEDIIEVCQILKSKNKFIYISYLNLDYNLQPFNNIALLAHADVLVSLSSICKICNNNLTKYTCLKSPNIKKTDKILIGGIDTYIPICYNCYIKSNITLD